MCLGFFALGNTITKHNVPQKIHHPQKHDPISHQTLLIGTTKTVVPKRASKIGTTCRTCLDKAVLVGGCGVWGVPLLCPPPLCCRPLHRCLVLRAQLLNLLYMARSVLG